MPLVGHANPIFLPREQTSKKALRAGVARLAFRHVVYYFPTRDHELFSFTHMSDRPLTPFSPQGARRERSWGGRGAGADLMGHGGQRGETPPKVFGAL